MQVINLTPHDIYIIDEHDRRVVTLPSAGIARAESGKTPAEPLVIDGVDIPVFVVEFGAPIGLPAPKSGVGYVVSTITAQAAARAGRTTVDLFPPDGTPVRDANGQIIGVHALAKAGA